MLEVASAYKVAYHADRLEAYLRGERIFPASLELDITTGCNRSCAFCPSTTRPMTSSLDPGFIKRLFARLEGQTRGLLLSGGEPTISPIFPDVLRMAREYGFIDIAIVTNGDFLDRERVAAALCAYASTVRVSVYDWTKEPREVIQATSARIRNLRSRREKGGSELQIGVSALTTKENANDIGTIAQQAASAGADWIYFHPMCIRWDVGAPERVNQSGVLAKINECRRTLTDGFRIFSFPDRYIEHGIEFSAYHAAHFLLVIGADGMNYLGAEVKYHPQYVIADLSNSWGDDFLWREDRLRRIASFNSEKYPAIASRHRGILYNHVIQNLIDRAERSVKDVYAKDGETYQFPHIL